MIMLPLQTMGMIMKVRWSNMKKIILAFATLLALFLFLNSIVITHPNEFSIITEFGEIKSERTQAGVSFKIPFVQSVEKIPSNILLYDLSSSDVITQDKKTMITDSYVTWQITNPTLFSQTLNATVTKGESLIDVTVYNALKTVIGSLSQTELISGRDGILSQQILDTIGDSMEKYGITLITIETKHLDLPDSNKEAVYERMISERENIATTYTAQGESEALQIRNTTNNEINVMISNANLEAQKLIAEGEAEYMRILQKAYANESRSEFYSFVRALDAAKVSLAGNNKTLILSSDSPIARIFYAE